MKLSLLWFLSAVLIVTFGVVLSLAGGAWIQGWLVAVMAWGLVPLGSLALLMVHGLTGGEWGHTSRPVLVLLTSTLPLFLLGMAPLALNLEALFNWLAPEDTLAEVVRHKTLYLNEPFLLLRWLVYAGVWLGTAWCIGVWGSAARPVREWAGAVGLILWVVTLTFFGFDWFMSLEPRFYSDVFGLMLCMLATGAAFALIFLLEPFIGRGPMSTGGRRDLANLWLSVQLGWALMAFSQYIIIWSGNLPHEIEWYVHRRGPPWNLIGLISFVLYFVVPLLILLSGSAKGSGYWLRAAATSTLVGYHLQVVWLIAPAFETTGPFSWLLPLLIVGVGACHALAVTRQPQDRRRTQPDPASGGRYHA